MKDGKKIAIGLGVIAVAALYFANKGKAVALAEAEREIARTEIPLPENVFIDPITGAVQTYDPETGTLTLNVEWTMYTFDEARQILFDKYPELEQHYWTDVNLYAQYTDWTSLMWEGLSEADAAEQATDWLVKSDGTLILIPPAVKEARLLWESTGMTEPFNLETSTTEYYQQHPDEAPPWVDIPWSDWDNGGWENTWENWTDIPPWTWEDNGVTWEDEF